MDTLSYMPEGNGSLSGLPTNKGTYYEMQRLQERHKELLRLLVLGVSKKEIASTLGITYAMVLYVEKSVLGQEYLEFLRGEREEVAIDIQSKIDGLAAPAVDVIRQAISGVMEVGLTDPETGEDKKVKIPVKQEQRIKASQDILSRHSQGYSPRQRINGTIQHDHIHNMGDIIGNVKKRAALLNSGEIEEAEVIEEEGTNNKEGME